MTAWRKYWAFARIAANQAVTQRGDLYGRALFFAVILGVFSALWRAVAEAGMPLSARQEQLVWYLAVTEWILLSVPACHLDIQEEIRRGDVAYQLGRPLSYPRAAFARGLGTLLVRAPALGVVACGCAYGFTGWWPPASALLLVVPLGLFASVVLAELWVALGLVAFWLSDATPLYWVASKLLFVLGGLMLPLELYPPWLQLTAACTPFPVLLAGPAGLLLHEGNALGLLLRLLFWGGCMLCLVELVFWRATRTLQLNGG